MGRSALSLATLTATLSLTLAAPALATTQTVQDPRGDAKSDVDMKSVTVADSNGTITVTIRTFKALKNGARPCLNVRAGKHATTNNYWFVGCFGPKPNKATTSNGRDSKTVRYKLKSHSLTLTFKASLLGVGTSFRWRAVHSEQDKIAEATPNHGWAKHTMDPVVPSP
jgi:hypothetical protein